MAQAENMSEPIIRLDFSTWYEERYDDQQTIADRKITVSPLLPGYIARTRSLPAAVRSAFLHAVEVVTPAAVEGSPDAEESLFTANLAVRPSLLRPSSVVAPGVYVIMGRTAGGKTRMVEDLASRLSPVGSVGRDRSLIIPLGEPMTADGPTPAMNVWWVQEALQRLVDETRTSSSVDDVPRNWFIDSLRLAQYTSTGAAIKGGINAAFFELLTELSIVATKQNIRLFAVINPNAEATEKYAELKAAIAGSVTGIIDVTDNRVSARTVADRREIPVAEFVRELQKSSIGRPSSESATGSRPAVVFSETAEQLKPTAHERVPSKMEQLALDTRRAINDRDHLFNLEDM